MLNKVLLIGNVGKQPDTKTVGGTPLATFAVAINERYRDKSGEMQERTEWVNIEAWGKLAEFVGKYVNKGTSLFIEGSIKTSTSGDGPAKRYYTSVRADIIRFVGPKPTTSQPVASEESDL